MIRWDARHDLPESSVPVITFTELLADRASATGGDATLPEVEIAPERDKTFHIS